MLHIPGIQRNLKAVIDRSNQTIQRANIMAQTEPKHARYGPFKICWLNLDAFKTGEQPERLLLIILVARSLKNF